MGNLRSLWSGSLGLLLAVGAACGKSPTSLETRAAAPPETAPAGETTPPHAETETASPPLTTTPKALLAPQRLRQKAPARFAVTMTTSEGRFVVQVTRAWAPRGADRFYNLVRAGFYRGVRIHRVVEGSLVQFGIHGDIAVNRAWFPATLADDVRRKRNQRGFVALAGNGPNDRRTELIINTRSNPELDRQGIAPFGVVVRGMNVVDRLRPPNPPGSAGPVKRYVLTMGEAYLARHFPKAARIEHVALAR